MILVAVGTQFPFDRLVRTVDAWAQANGRTDVIAQMGPSDYQPVVLKGFGMIAPDAFARLQRDAEVIVAHAGMGSILGALEASTPIIIMPRVHALGEHRNDHQLATARQFGSLPGVAVAMDEDALRARLDRLDELKRPAERIGSGAPEAFIARLRAFVVDGARA